MTGEAVASGSYHPDNVAPCLFGGLILTRSMDPPDVIRVPTPSSIRCVLVHPHRTVETRAARSKVPLSIPVGEVVQQTAHIGAFVAGCYRGDVDLIGRSLRDFIAEPRRAELVPGFADVKAAAMDAGALGCSLAGAGPSVFAWVDGEGAAESVREAMRAAFDAHDVQTDTYVCGVDEPGAALEGQMDRGETDEGEPA